MLQQLTEAQVETIETRHDRISANLVMATALDRGSADLVDVISATETLANNGLDFSRTRALYVVSELLGTGDMTLSIPGSDIDESAGQEAQITELNNCWAEVRNFDDLRRLATLTPTFEGRLRSQQLSSHLGELTSEQMTETINADLTHGPMSLEEIRCRYVLGRYADPVGEAQQIISSLIAREEITRWTPDRARPADLVDPEDLAELVVETIDCLAGWDEQRNNRSLLAAGWLKPVGEIGATAPLWETEAPSPPAILPGAFSLPPYMLNRRKSTQVAAQLTADLVDLDTFDTTDIAWVADRIRRLDSQIVGGHLRLVCLDFLGRWAARGLWRLGRLDNGEFTPISGGPEKAIAVFGKEWYRFEEGRFGLRLLPEGVKVGEHRRRLRQTEWETRDLATLLLHWAYRGPVDLAEFKWLIDYSTSQDPADWTNVMAYSVKQAWLRYVGCGDTPDTSTHPSADWRRVDTMLRIIPDDMLSRAGSVIAIAAPGSVPESDLDLLPDIFVQEGGDG